MKNETKETEVFARGDYFGVLVENPTREEWAEAAEATDNYDGRNYITEPDENYTDIVVVERIMGELVPVPRGHDIYEFFPPGAEYSEEAAASELEWAERSGDNDPTVQFLRKVWTAKTTQEITNLLKGNYDFLCALPKEERNDAMEIIMDEIVKR